MDRKQVLEIIFLSFIKENRFIDQDFKSIWDAFVEKRKRSDNEVNFNLAYFYFRNTLEAEYFFVDRSTVPFRYTSIFQFKDPSNSCNLNEAYRKICKAIETLTDDFTRNKIELSVLNTYLVEFPLIYDKLDHLIFKRKQLEVEIQSKINVLNDLLKELAT
ncbi:hypothetical protein WBV44_17560 [Acinetobacter baumannii]|uniref:hypothetical protein n=1 Tax=Acinetobacter calcoaceticus/baumannii complex TaxID=909768 RepID=UPI0018DCC7FD|nr:MULTISPECIES: hypothetical protein [Acinetobacter calcoaceticus/baumannii complex]MDH2546103.1 hypothetical protein [Acinetobacter baumannii]MDO7209455.1 hypothetical protein [Acinetobacter nosocomialis]MDO7231452.1 hypothetical protein [Acinetobacter nosocomialis]MDO7435682.1 hypothetical protein [Acinetobacter nosocomialis]MDV7449454.1 hypothetical protein [Acinetobacter baumannii]